MKKAYTFIELLIVISIIAILAVVIVIAIGSSQTKSRDTKRKADLIAISSALELYKSQKGSYPLSTACTDLIKNYGTDFTRLDQSSPCSAVNELVVNNYLSAFPKDPKSTKVLEGYYYSTKNSGGANYKLVKLNPELLDPSFDIAKCQEIAGDFYDPLTGRNCRAYQVTSNLAATKDW